MEINSSDLVERVASIRQPPYSHPISENEYRVVHVLPGKFTDEIQCVLETRSFRVKTRYEALSYQWGDEAIKKPIQVAEFRPTSMPPPDLEIPTKTLTDSLKAIREAGEQHSFIWRVVTWIIVTATLFYCGVFSFFAPLPRGPPNWRLIFIPGNIFAFVLVLLSGFTCEELLAKGLNLFFEMAETKPWQMGHSFGYNKGARGKNGDDKSFEFLTVEVTTNLALALRYLRREKGVRTLWIDSLCIYQGDEDEKRVQIQRMDWIYANASPVVIWLGGYHGLDETGSCPESSTMEADECEHKRQIQAAFDYIRIVSGWRQLFGWYFRHDKRTHFEASRPGFCQLATREYWERLWVIQEVALATGCVQVQCGYYVCDLGNFESAQPSVTWQHRHDKVIQDNFQKVENFRDTINGFRYSYLSDRQSDFTKVCKSAALLLVTTFFREKIGKVASFHEQDFPHKLQVLLLKTAGHFKCRDDRDRLHAVLGIASGAKKGSVSQLADLIETASSPAARMIIASQIDVLFKKSAFQVQVALMAFILVYASWGTFYATYAKHWTLMRPNYVVAEYKKDIGAVTDESSRSGFFTALAIYLARENKSLALLDAASCGNDEDKDIPSWVPTWSKETNPKAYDFTVRTKEVPAQDDFEITKNGKTLRLLGLPMGRIRKILSPAELETLSDWPWYWAYETLLVHPFIKALVKNYLQLIGTLVSERTYSAMSDSWKNLIATGCQGIKEALELGAMLLRDVSAGSVVVFTYDALTLTDGVGFMKAGDEAVVERDSILYVPGCFHGLVLRCISSRGFGGRWKMVGLIQMVERKAYSQSEWAQVRKDGGLCWVNIE